MIIDYSVLGLELEPTYSMWFSYFNLLDTFKRRRILMQTMQDFYNWLFKGQESDDSYRRDLFELTGVDPTQLSNIESDPGWQPWDAQTVEASTS